MTKNLKLNSLLSLSLHQAPSSSESASLRRGEVAQPSQARGAAQSCRPVEPAVPPFVFPSQLMVFVVSPL